MDLEKLDGLKVYILESLRPEDKRTGEDLRDNLRQIWYNQRLYDFDCQYYLISNRNEFSMQMADIEKQVLEKNKLPIIQLECHGSSEGICLSSDEKVCWKDLFDRLRPINIASWNFLLLNLSMCNGETVIRYIDPKQRAPFRAVTGSEGEVFPDFLENAWTTFYTKMTDSFLEDYGLHKLAQMSGLVYYSQEFIFDAHFDLANMDPELFIALRSQEMYEMYKIGGPLAMNPEVYRRWIAKQQGKIKEKYKSLFCFEDLKPFYKEVYDRWHQKNDKSSK